METDLTVFNFIVSSSKVIQSSLGKRLEFLFELFFFLHKSGIVVLLL